MKLDKLSFVELHGFPPLLGMSPPARRRVMLPLLWWRPRRLPKRGRKLIAETKIHFPSRSHFQLRSLGKLLGLFEPLSL